MIPRPGSPAAILIASDHSAFVGVMTNLLLGLIAAVATTRDRTAATLERLALAVLNLGLVVFVVGLVADSAEIKRIGAPTMGTAILVAAALLGWRLWQARSTHEPEGTPLEVAPA